jgi:hypothetical protein
MCKINVNILFTINLQAWDSGIVSNCGHRLSMVAHKNNRKSNSRSLAESENTHTGSEMPRFGITL